jgi:apolipoprotein D and lipocalin family protein
MILRALKYYFSDRKKNAAKGEGTDTTPSNSVCWGPYLGRWYEWARYDTPFEYGLDNVYTEYEAINDEEVRITNYGTDEKGTQETARAKATKDGDGRLLVSFIPLLRFIATPYHVLYVDEDYRNALVSNESGSCLWFLGRTPQYSTEDYKRLCMEAEARGFDTSLLRVTNHH